MREKNALDLRLGDYIKKEEENGNSLEEKVSDNGNIESKINETGSISETSFGESGKTGVGDALLGALAGSTMTEVFKNMMSSSKGTFGSNIAGENSNADNAEEMKSQVFYRGKNVRLRINDEVMDIKDVEMNINKEFSKHDDLFMRFTIKNEELSRYYSYEHSFGNTLGVELAKSEMDFKRIFHAFDIVEMGIEENISERAVVTIRTKSATYDMDKTKRFKSYQDMNITYEEMIKPFMEEHSGIEFFLGSELKYKLKKPYIQFNETNWEFMARVANDLNIPLFSHLNSLIMGNKINLMEEEPELRNTRYERSRKGVNLIFRVKGATQAVNAGQRMIITVPGQGPDGEKGQDKRIVSRANIRIDGDQVVTDYELIQEDHEFDPVENVKFEGKSIEGTVMEVVSEDGIAKMKVDLSAGLLKLADGKRSIGYEDEYKGGFNFPYMTGFSQGSTGFFCTPDKGDRVLVTFLSGNESHAYVFQGAVNSPGNDRFNNPNVRNYTLGGDDSAGGKPMFDFQLNSKVFNVNTTDSINLVTKGTATLSATSGNVNVSGGSAVSVSSKSSSVNMDNSSIALNSSGTLDAVSSNVTITGVSKAEVVGGDVDVN